MIASKEMPRVRPMDSPDSICDLGTASIPARRISVRYAPPRKVMAMIADANPEIRMPILGKTK